MDHPSVKSVQVTLLLMSLSGMSVVMYDVGSALIKNVYDLNKNIATIMEKMESRDQQCGECSKHIEMLKTYTQENKARIDSLYFLNDIDPND